MATTIQSGRSNSPLLTADVASRAEIFGGRGLVFDGSTDYLDIIKNFTGAFSISFWIYPHDVTDSGVGVIGISPQDSNYIRQGSQSLYIRIASAGSTYSTGNVLSNNVWTFFTITRDDSNVLKWYVDGAYTGSSATQSGTFEIEHIGKSAIHHFDGALSDLKFYSSALTEAEVQSQYLKPESVPSPSTLVAWYPMSEANPESPQSIVYDHSEKKLGGEKVANATDWTDSNSDGLADNWTDNYAGKLDYSIVTGNGFTGNAQRFEVNDVAGNDRAIRTSATVFTSGTLYKVSFKYRASISSGSILVMDGGSGATVTNITTHTGDAKLFETYYVAPTGSHLWFYMQSANADAFMEIDEVSIKEVLMGNHATTNFFGSELNPNPTFSNFTGNVPDGWGVVGDDDSGNNISQGSAGGLRIQSDGGSIFVHLADVTVVGKTYKYSITLANLTDDDFNFNSGGTTFFTADGSSVGTHTGTFVAVSTYVRVIRLSSCDGEVTAFSLKEVGISSSGFTTAQNEPVIPQIPLVKYNEKMCFNGNNGYISIPSTTLDIDGSTISFSWWCKLNTINEDHYVFSGTQYFKNITFFNGGLRLESDTNDNTMNWYFTNDTNMHHYVLTTNGSGGSELFRDTISLGTKTGLSNNLTINAIGHSSSDAVPNGYFDEYAIWNTELNASQRIELFADGLALDATTHSKSGNLLAYYRNDGVTTWTDRRGWSYLDFDGTGDRAENTSFTTHQSTTGTISGWFKFDDVSTQQRFFGVGGSTTIGATRSLEVDGGNIWSINYGSANVQDWNTTASVAVGTWYHLAVSWNGSVIVVYVNGVAYSNSGLSLTTPQGTKVQVGGAVWNGQDELNGQAKSASFYTSVLSQSEIQSIYNNGINSSEIGNSNLAHYWILDNETTIKDLVGSNDLTVTDATLNTGNTGTVAGSPDSITIREGLNSNKDGLGFPFTNPSSNVLRLNGSSEYVDLEVVSGFTNINAFSIEAWVKPNKVNANQAIVAFGSNTSSSPEGKRVSLFLASTAKPTLAFWGNDVVSDGTINASQWVHLAMTFAGGNRTSANSKIYINGVSQTLSGGTASALDLSDMDFCRIGADYVPSQLFEGLLDEVRIYNKELSLAEIQKNYKHQKGKHKND